MRYYSIKKYQRKKARQYGYDMNNIANELLTPTAYKHKRVSKKAVKRTEKDIINRMLTPWI
jgi:hypothetical protein